MTDDGAQVEPLPSGVTVTPLRVIQDERGAVLHMMRRDAPDFVDFGECYFSEVLPGAVKGWKRHRKQTQNLAAPVGRIRIVLFDDRDGSPTRGAINVMEIGRPDRYIRVRIPPGIWYGFGCVGPVPALVANCADVPHDPSEGETRPLGDAAIPYSWTGVPS